MPFDRPQPGPYKRGDSLPGAGEYNALIRGGRRQITGPNVSEYGDRTNIEEPKDRSVRPEISNFLQKFVVLQVQDDYLICKVVQHGVNPTTGWWQSYDSQAVAAVTAR